MTRDLTASSSQGRSTSSEEARELGERLYREIMVDRNMASAEELRQLADASENMDSAVEVPDPRAAGGRLSRILAAASSILSPG